MTHPKPFRTFNERHGGDHLERAFIAWSEALDRLCEQSRNHSSDCQAAGDRIDAFLREQSNG